MLRHVLLAASRSPRLKELIETAPVTSDVVRRFVAGDRTEDAVDVARDLIGSGFQVSLDHLGEDTLDPAQAARNRDTYLDLLRQLEAAGLSPNSEVSLKLTALGQRLRGGGEKQSLEYAREICDAAARHGALVTLDMEDHTTTVSTLYILGELRHDFPWVGIALQSYLRRTEGDCRELATEGSRTRLVKGAYDEPISVAHAHRHDVDLAYVRCMKILMKSPAYPMIATHDPRLIDISGSLAMANRRERRSYEYQFLYGVRPDEQKRLLARGERVRIYMPYGTQWYGYLMRRLAERPANLSFFLRSVVSKG